jgi:hypothetical protein
VGADTVHGSDVCYIAKYSLYLLDNSLAGTDWRRAVANKVVFAGVQP